MGGPAECCSTATAFDGSGAAAYGQLPLSFEANNGQIDSHVQFLSRGHGHQLFLTPNDAVLAFRTGEAKGERGNGEAYQRQLSNTPPPPSQSMVRMRFDGANSHAEMVGLDKLPGIVNYFIGGDPVEVAHQHPHVQEG
jgi:hypothetical protein